MSMNTRVAVVRDHRAAEILLDVKGRDEAALVVVPEVEAVKDRNAPDVVFVELRGRVHELSKLSELPILE
jgi:hypothetical protein